MVIVQGYDIKLSRGDTLNLTVTFEGDVPENGTTAIFSVKENARSNTPIIEKTYNIEDGKININVESDETNTKAIGNYIWDIRIIYENNDVFTPFRPALFQLMEAVGNV